MNNPFYTFLKKITKLNKLYLNDKESYLKLYYSLPTNITNKYFYTHPSFKYFNSDNINKQVGSNNPWFILILSILNILENEEDLDTNISKELAWFYNEPCYQDWLR